MTDLSPKASLASDWFVSSTNWTASRRLDLASSTVSPWEVLPQKRYILREPSGRLQLNLFRQKFTGLNGQRGARDQKPWAQALRDCKWQISNLKSAICYSERSEDDMALEALSHCPWLAGLRPEPNLKNVGSVNCSLLQSTLLAEIL